MIELVPYDPTWPDRFACEATLLRELIGAAAIRIDHVGSTSIPGTPAKPVIDVQITVVALAPLADWVEHLARLDYTHHASADDSEYPFFHKPVRWPHVYHVHLCEPRSVVGRATLALRDFLRDRPELREAYAEEKRRLAAVHVGDTPERREAYARGKSPFLEPLIERALALGYPHT
jgi:GrpB-like predicted nucleotidyltransferase (UPF0157 family)